MCRGLLHKSRPRSDTQVTQKLGEMQLLRDFIPTNQAKTAVYLSCFEAKNTVGRQQPEPEAYRWGQKDECWHPAPLFHSHVESPLAYDPRPFPPLPLISLFLILLWTQAGLSLRMCHHPQVVSGEVFCWQRPVPPIQCVDRLAQPRLHLKRESPHSHASPRHREASGVTRGKEES
uniref:Uncharacterized protein n=1 Tax=Rousettus aegyptiacus TaxID=9407 RepID=A0A7J8CI86_ROUAE|nr:hypothetical protein HJG63_009025 [Rousettus aegyptiacus]